MRAILTIAHLTIHDARRRRILAAALLLGLAFLAVFSTGLHFAYRDMTRTDAAGPLRTMALNFIVMAGLYAANFLVVMTSVLTGVDTLSGEIGSGVIETLATKPVSRTAILLGKWLGCLVLVATYFALLCGGVLAAGYLIAGFVPPNAHRGLPLILLEGTVLMSLSVAWGTRLQSLTNGVTVFGLYGIAFIGGWMEQIGTLISNDPARYIGITASLLVPSESLWQLAAYQMQPPLMRDINLTPFSPASVPSPAMVAWALAYVVAVVTLGLAQFRSRDL
jgi:Cu-processing system permease protein